MLEALCTGSLPLIFADLLIRLGVPQYHAASLVDSCVTWH